MLSISVQADAFIQKRKDRSAKLLHIFQEGSGVFFKSFKISVISQGRAHFIGDYTLIIVFQQSLEKSWVIQITFPHRHCHYICGININIAKVFDAFGIGKIANPLEAHIGYAKDDRVVALIADGIGNDHTDPIIKDKCEWTEITD